MRKSDPPKTSHTLPASQALQLVELAQRWGVAAEQLLAGTELTVERLEAPHTRLPLPAMIALIERTRALTGEPGIGVYLGLQKRISKYGYLGFAAMNAATLREAIDLAVSFAPIVTTAITLRLDVEGELAALTAIEHADWGSARDVGVLSFVLGLQQILGTLTGQASPVGRHVELPIRKPAYFDRFAHLLPVTRFEAPATRIVFDSAALSLPLLSADRAALRLAREQCERELAALGFDSTMPARVRRLILHASGVRSLEEVAGELHLSSRTLKRRLAEAGTSFSELLDDERRERALLLLRSRDTALEAIAQRLGFSSVPNFVRAFRRWTGTTPTAYRRLAVRLLPARVQRTG